MTMTKKRIQQLPGLIAAMAFSAAAMQGATIGSSEPMAWRFAHPEAQILAGVNFRKLAETADGRQLRDQFAAALGAPLLEQAERLLLSSVVDANGRRSDVLILSGSFSLPQLRKIAAAEGARIAPYKGMEIAAPERAAADDPHLAWIPGPGGATTVLIGTRPAIQAAAERSKAHVESLAALNPLFGRARELGVKYPIWISCETVPRGFGPKALDRFAEDGDGLDVGQIDGFDVGIQAGRTAAMNMWVWTASEATANAVLKQLQDAVDGPERFVLSSWLSQLQGSIEASTLVLGAPMAAGTVAARVGPMLAAFALPVDAKAPTAAPTAEPRLAVAVPVEPKKLFVRIEGMDEGRKDIPYTMKP
jgi:hypothetical protein